ASSYIEKAAANGLVLGYPDGSFRPDASITRAETVTVINRMLRRGIAPADVPDWAATFYDVPDTHWAYAMICEAATAHEYKTKADGGLELWAAGESGA
ncbi:MAG: S-layer homology domain-containing protein, partial [Clostridiales bacterium]|nr:S-layer homology domain-containing protein [Clostridiales bacterium]